MPSTRRGPSLVDQDALKNAVISIADEPAVSRWAQDVEMSSWRQMMINVTR
jgi:hypothetical protein